MRLFAQSVGISEGGPTPPVGEQLVLPGMTYPNDEGIIPNPGSVTWGSGVMGNYQYEPQVFRILDKTFFTVSSKYNPNSGVFIGVYDHYRNKCSDIIDTGLVFRKWDSHHRVSIFYDPADHTKLFIYGVDRQNGPKITRISRCGANFDVFNWEPWTEFDGVGDPVRMDLMEYPHWQFNAAGDVCSVVRFPGWMAFYIKSPDLTNWSRQIICTFDGVGDQRPYPLHIYSEDNVTRTFFNHVDFETNPSGTIVPWLYYMWSDDDGTTWHNVDDSFSKNVVANDGITLAELKTHFVATSGSPTAGVVKGYSATLINGNPYAFCGWQDTGELSLIYWSGSAWVVKKVVVGGVTFSRTESITGELKTFNNHIVYDNGTITGYVTENDGSGSYACKIQSTDNGDTWTYERLDPQTSSSKAIGTYNKYEGTNVIVINSNSDEMYLMTGD